MIDWSKYEKIGEFKNDLLTWFAPNFENVVYCIKFTDEFFYIGSTQNLRRRFSQYVPALKHNKYDSLALSDAFLEYGAFEIYILEVVTAETLRENEAYYINMLSPILNSQGAPKETKRMARTHIRIKEILRQKISHKQHLPTN